MSLSSDAVAAESPQSPTFAHLNLVTTVVGFVISLGIGLWYTPFLVRHLGPAVYGLVPLATTVVSYFSLLTQTLSSALNRSISVALVSGNRERANLAFGSALGGALLLVALLLPPVAALSWIAPHLFSVPDGMNTEIRLLFAFLGASLLLSVLSTPYQSLTFSQNRIYVSNLVSSAQALIRVGLTAALFTLGANLLDAGWGILVSGLAALLFTMACARTYSPHVSMLRLQVDPAELRVIARTSGHVLLMQVGTVLVMSVEIVIANRMFGAADGGRYAAVTQWLLILRNATLQIGVLAVPTILRLVASNDRPELIAFTQRAMCWCAIAAALPVGFLCALSPKLLRIWLGDAFVEWWPLAVVQLAPLVLTTCVLPLYSVSLGANKVLVSGLVQIAIGVVGVAAAIGFGLGWGPIGIAIGVNWSFAIKELLFTPAYAASNIGASWHTFYPPIFAGVLLVGLAAALSRFADQLFDLTTFSTIFLAGVGVSLIYAVICASFFPALPEQVLELTNFRTLLARLGIGKRLADK